MKPKFEKQKRRNTLDRIYSRKFQNTLNFTGFLVAGQSKI